MLTVREIVKITKGACLQESASLTVKGVSIDSRTVKKGDVFVAVKGARFDGHAFAARAARRGAAAVVVAKKISVPKHVAVIRVKDTTRALGHIAAWHRRRFDIPVVAVTGSTGKTTTKDLIAAVLSKKFRVLKNVGTLNNQFGVPLTLLKLRPTHGAVVVECGTNQPGDIRALARIVRPTVCVYTNVGAAHLEKLKSPSGVFREKIQLVNAMVPGGTVVVNADDAFLAKIPKRYKGNRVLRYGRGVKADCRAVGVEVRGNSALQFRVGGHVMRIKSCAAHNVENALAAICCGRLFKINYNIIAAALGSRTFGGGRLEVRKAGPLWIVDDTYNANPVSFQSAVSTLHGLRIKGKRIIVCADMLELGARAVALHRQVGEMIAQSGVDAVLSTGKLARHITRAVKRRDRDCDARHCKDMAEVKRQLKRLIRPGDAVLVKGSRAMHMERVLESIV